MDIAYPMQKFQDWFTQQWVILWGKKINPKAYPWLMGPFGNLGGIGTDFIKQLSEKENLIIQKNSLSNGLIPSMENLNFSAKEYINLSKEIIHFYEHTTQYNLALNVKWNPIFKLFGILVNRLFSKRINQLNIPTKNTDNAEAVTSEIITLLTPNDNTVKYTFWLRTFAATGQVIYSGIYSTCTLASGKTCIKAVFPLPKGNATVIMTPEVTQNGALILNSSGKNFGDAGFYFLLNDAKGNYWAQYIRSFRDKLIIGTNEKKEIKALQTLSLWNSKVVQFEYGIKEK